MFPIAGMAGLAVFEGEDATRGSCTVGVYETVPTSETTLSFRDEFNDNAMH
jgi:hypothetical protein